MEFAVGKLTQNTEFTIAQTVTLLHTWIVVENMAILEQRLLRILIFITNLKSFYDEIISDTIQDT